jgi:DNA repair protein RecO (recombination protein O)
MTHKTKGIVLRTTKYGETSLIVLLFTEKFGTQSYLINGVRTSSKKGSGKANLFQPGALLDIIVYHSEQRQLQRIKEFKWGFLYQHIFSDIRKNAVAVFMIELLTKCLKQTEPNEELFHFAEDAFVHLDECNEAVTANFALFFALQLTNFFGIPPNPLNENLVSTENLYFDLKEGNFTNEQPLHPHFIESTPALITAELLKVMQPEELEDIKLNHDFRRNLLHTYETYYALHVQDFGTMKTLPVLKEIF